MNSAAEAIKIQQFRTSPAEGWLLPASRAGLAQRQKQRPLAGCCVVATAVIAILLSGLDDLPFFRIFLVSSCSFVVVQPIMSPQNMARMGSALIVILAICHLRSAALLPLPEASIRKEKVIHCSRSISVFAVSASFSLGRQPAVYIRTRWKVLTASLFIAINACAVRVLDDPKYARVVWTFGLLPFSAVLSIVLCWLHGTQIAEKARSLLRIPAWACIMREDETLFRPLLRRSCASP